MYSETLAISGHPDSSRGKRYIQPPMLRYCQTRIPVLQASKCNNPLMQRRWPGLLLAPLVEGPRGMWETDAGPRIGRTTAYIRRQTLQDVSQNEGDFSTPRPGLSNSHSSLACLFAHPGDPCSAVSSKRYLPCRLQRLKEFVRLKEGLDTQSVEDPKCEQKKEYVSRNRRLFDSFCGVSPETLAVIDVNGTVQAKLG